VVAGGEGGVEGRRADAVVDDMDTGTPGQLADRCPEVVDLGVVDDVVRAERCRLGRLLVRAAVPMRVAPLALTSWTSS